jgi:CRP/FNR family transcriptional regulator, cyclic AMP receptor protein
MGRKIASEFCEGSERSAPGFPVATRRQSGTLIGGGPAARRDRGMKETSRASHPEPLWYVQSSEIFGRLKEKEMEEFVARGRLAGFERGQQIYAEGDPGDLVYFIKRGGVKIVTTHADGKEITLAYLKPLELFGETALTDPAPREHRAVATEECCLIAFAPDVIEDFMRRNPDLGLSITKFVGLRLKRVQSRLQRLMFRSPLQRLASVLLELAEDYGETDPRTGQIEINLRITHNEIASLIGVTRESVTYAMGQLELDEFIRVVKRRIFIVDTAALKELCA